MIIKNVELLVSGKARDNGTITYLSKDAASEFINKVNSGVVYGEYGQINAAVRMERCETVESRIKAQQLVPRDHAVVRYSNASFSDGVLRADVELFSPTLYADCLYGTIGFGYRGMHVREEEKITLSSLFTFDLIPKLQDVCAADSPVMIKRAITKNTEWLKSFIKPITDLVFRYYPNGDEWLNDVFLKEYAVMPISNPSSNRDIYVAMDPDDGELLGVCLVKTMTVTKSKICSFYTIPESGAGDLLMMKALESCCPHSPVVITVPEERGGMMIPLLERHGFVQTNVIDSPYREGVKEYIFTKIPTTVSENAVD